MYAAVLHTLGIAPRYEEFPEPVVNDNDADVIVHVHAASLKPVSSADSRGGPTRNRSRLGTPTGRLPAKMLR